MPRRLKGMPYRGSSASRVNLQKALTAARRKAAVAQQEVKRLEKLWNSQRPWYACKRCGHEWQGVDPLARPKCCARCHSKGWETESKAARARKPTDAPNPSWDGRRGGPKRKKESPPEPAPPPVSTYTESHPIELKKDFGPSHPLAEPIPEPIDLIEEMRRAINTPPGLPPPPVIGVDLGFKPPIVVYAPPPEPPLMATQMPSPPVLYRPREAEPQPETISSSRPATVTRVDEGSAIGRTEAEPPVNWEQVAYLESIFPQLSPEDVIYAEQAEAAWETAETDA